MNRFLMSYNAIFPSYLIVTLWTLESMAHMNRFLMLGQLSELLDSHTLDIEISGQYEQISDEIQGYLVELLDSPTLGIGIAAPYERL